MQLSDRKARFLAKSVLLEESGSPAIIRMVTMLGMIVLCAFSPEFTTASTLIADNHLKNNEIVFFV